MTQVGIVVIEDDAMVREWVRGVLEPSDLRLLATAETADDGLRAVDDHQPDLILIDYGLPDRLGPELVREFRGRGVRAPVVVMSANAETGLNENAREAGAQGTFLKSGDAEALLEVLNHVRAGGLSFDPKHPKRPPGRPALSPRERQVLSLVARGATNREAASQLGIGEQTVKTLLARIYAKLGVGRRSEAVAAAYETGVLRRT